jgi:hypothetical protein
MAALHSRHLGPALALLAWACVAPAPPTVPLAFQGSAFAGTVLTGPSVERDGSELDLEGSWLLVTRISWYPEPPRGERPLAGRLVLREGDADLFVTRSELAAGIQEGLPAGWRPEEAPLWSEERTAALPAGATSTLDAQPLPSTAGSGPAWERLRLEVARPTDGSEALQVALVLEGEILPLVTVDPLSEELPPPPVPVRVTERLVIERPPAVDGRRLFLVLAAPTPDHPQGGFVLELLARRPEGEVPEELLAATRAEISRSAETARDRARRFREQLVLRTESMGEAIARGQLPRSAVLAIAQSCEAHVAEELALVATEEDLADFVRRASEQRAEQPARNTAELGWIVEERAMRWLLERRADEDAPLPPELEAVLIRACGALAAAPDLLLEVLGRSADLADFQRQVHEENLAALEDARPAPRVRAFDWLEARGEAPEGYDPLGERDARRAALALYAERRAAGEEDRP